MEIKHITGLFCVNYLLSLDAQIGVMIESRKFPCVCEQHTQTTLKCYWIKKVS